MNFLLFHSQNHFRRKSISFAQYQVDKKSNKITAIPALFDMITCENSVITIDAMSYQKEIVKKIREKKADYLIALKANPKNLYFGEISPSMISTLPICSVILNSFGNKS